MLSLIIQIIANSINKTPITSPFLRYYNISFLNKYCIYTYMLWSKPETRLSLYEPG